MGNVILIFGFDSREYLILRVFCKSLHATPQALGYNTGTTNNMGTKIEMIKNNMGTTNNIIKKHCSSTRSIVEKVEINSKFKLLYLPSGEGRPSDRRRDIVDWRKPPQNNM